MKVTNELILLIPLLAVTADGYGEIAEDQIQLFWNGKYEEVAETFTPIFEGIGEEIERYDGNPVNHPVHWSSDFRSSFDDVLGDWWRAARPFSYDSPVNEGTWLSQRMRIEESDLNRSMNESGFSVPEGQTEQEARTTYLRSMILARRPALFLDMIEERCRSDEVIREDIVNYWLMLDRGRDHRGQLDFPAVRTLYNSVNPVYRAAALELARTAGRPAALSDEIHFDNLVRRAGIFERAADDPNPGLRTGARAHAEEHLKFISEMERQSGFDRKDFQETEPDVRAEVSKRPNSSDARTTQLKKLDPPESPVEGPYYENGWVQPLLWLVPALIFVILGFGGALILLVRFRRP